MSGVRPRLSNAGPATVKAGAAIKGGQLVAPHGTQTGNTKGTGIPAPAGSTKVLGVAENDSKPWANPVSTDADGFEVINTSPIPTESAVGFGRYPVTYTTDCGWGEAIKAAANGAVAKWVSGTDAADLIVGYCDEPGGVVVATRAINLAYISR